MCLETLTVLLIYAWHSRMANFDMWASKGVITLITASENSHYYIRDIIGLSKKYTNRPNHLQIERHTTLNKLKR